MSILMSRNEQLAVTKVGDLLLVVAPGRGWSDADWQDHMEQTIELRKTRGSPAVVLTYSPDGSPSAKQRRVIAARSDELGVPECKAQVVISDSAIVRGALTAITWVARVPYAIRPFSPRHLGEGLTYLSTFAPFDRERAIETLADALDQLRATADAKLVRAVERR